MNEEESGVRPQCLIKKKKKTGNRISKDYGLVSSSGVWSKRTENRFDRATKHAKTKSGHESRYPELEMKQNKASQLWRQDLESIPEDHRMQVDADIYGMAVAELIGWTGDIKGSQPVWTTSFIASCHICQLVTKYLVSPYHGPGNGWSWTRFRQFC